MQYTYEFELFEGAQCYIAYPFDMEGATQGATVKETALMAADWLRGDIAHRLMHGLAIPDATFGNSPRQCGTVMLVSVEVTLDAIPKVSAAEAARILGVTPARVSHMLKSGLLEGFKDGNRSYVTRASVDARLKEPRKAGRPRKVVAD